MPTAVRLEEPAATAWAVLLLIPGPSQRRPLEPLVTKGLMAARLPPCTTIALLVRSSLALPAMLNALVLMALTLAGPPVWALRVRDVLLARLKEPRLLVPP